MGRKSYDKEFKISAIRLVKEEGKRVTEVARNLDIPEQTLHNWLNKYNDEKEAGFVGSGNLKPEDKAIRDLQKKLRDLEEENAILKKAMGIFAKSQK
ncbi:transposase [Schinkia azotoformans MEV2011]|uniref:Transposase n=1 Tax=Schinkia azotoformans MEV2011 TaxID=1348973 RepID=A0A072NF67_SCHAZ|nr:transposase [Schinkia azotoformans MEV2011]